MYHSYPPRALSASRAVTLGDAIDPCSSDSDEICMKLLVNRGRASTHQLRRVLADSDLEAAGLACCAGEVLEQCEICRAFDKAPRIPIAGTSIFSAINEEVRADLLFLDDAAAARAMYVSRIDAFFLPIAPRIVGVHGARFAGRGLPFFGRPRRSQMGEGCGGKRNSGGSLRGSSD